MVETASKYTDTIEQVIRKFDPQGSNRYFIFGSSVRKEKFHDIDLGVVGNKSSQKELSVLRDHFYDSPVPYKVDVVDMDSADSEFREYVLQKEQKVWIR